MFWIVIVAVVVIVAIVLPKLSGGRKTLRAETRDARARAAGLPRTEQINVADDIRATAADNYDRISAAADGAGKGQAFAHQVGVLQALQAVTAPGRQLSDSEHRALQVEAVPFNRLEPQTGRNAVIEYLVWKFFPEDADQSAFAPPLIAFRDQVYRDAEEEDDADDFTFKMLLSMKYDWQRWLSENTPKPE